jgi:hypothetical protein
MTVDRKAVGDKWFVAILTLCSRYYTGLPEFLI